MSAHSFPKIDQKEYLKKYLSGNKAKKKKKDKKHKKSSAASIKVKIIDDDINHLDSGPDIDEELLLTGEDAPQIVGEYIEEQPGDRKVPKWKSIVIKDEPDEASDGVKQNETDIWGHDSDKKRSIRTPDKSHSRKKERKRKSSSASPPQRRRKSPSPPRKSKTDKSPSRIRKKGGSPDFRAKVKTEPQSPKYTSRDQTRDYSYKALSPRRRDSDHSPPRRGKSPIRKSRNRSPYQSPPRHKIDSDQSLTKGIKRQDNSPPRRKENSSFHSPKRLRRDSDQSPPRKNKISVHSPSRCRSDSDQSPPRRDKRRDSDRSIPRKSKNSYDSSLRRNRHERQTPDCSPARKSKISPDQSPPRRRRNSDLSPPRKTKNVASKHKHRSPDQSPSRRRKKSPVEICINSPSTRVKREKQTPSPQLRRSRWEKQESDNSLSPPPTHKPKPGKTLEGKKAGLQDAKSLQKETMERRKQENILFEKMSADVSGRNAEVQVRATGRKGRRAREAAEEDPEERRRKEEHEAKKKLLYDRWGKGLKQIEDHKNRMLEQQYESSKPLARYSNDEDLERHLKEQERLEDPMLEYMRQKRKEKEKQSGKPQIPRYEGPYPENRFGIRPGYRWDGVDRSNGYEKKYFAVQNEKKARQDEAYKYSVEDM